MSTIIGCFNGRVEHSDCCELAENMSHEDSLIPDVRDVDSRNWLQEFISNILQDSEGQRVKVIIKIDIL